MPLYLFHPKCVYATNLIYLQPLHKPFGHHSLCIVVNLVHNFDNVDITYVRVIVNQQSEESDPST